VPAVVIADRECGAIQKARQLQIETVLIKKSDFPGNREKWAREIGRALMQHRVDMIFQN